MWDPSRGLSLTASKARCGTSELRTVVCRCALDPQPHMNSVGTTVMLSNLGNMASRELEGTPAPADVANDYIVSGGLVPRALREKLDAYSWTTVVIDTSSEEWTILYANQAFRTMTGT